MAKEKEKLFMDAMKKKFKEDPTEVHTHLLYLWWLEAVQEEEGMGRAGEQGRQGPWHPGDEPGYRCPARTAGTDAIQALSCGHLR